MRNDYAFARITTVKTLSYVIKETIKFGSLLIINGHIAYSLLFYCLEKSHFMNMNEENIPKLVIKMAMPMVISMMVTSLYNIVDSYFVSKINEEAMTALSLVYPIQNLVSAISIGFGIGVNAVVSYLQGAKRYEDANHAAEWSFVLSIIHGILLTIICIIVLPIYLKSYTNDQMLLQYGQLYGNIVLLFSLVISVTMVYEKLFQAVGQMQISMIAMLIGCVTNIILDPMMIFGIGFPKMGIEGAAVATGIGQIMTLIVYFICHALGKLPLNINLFESLKGISFTSRIYKTGIPASLNLALPSLEISMLNRILVSLSTSGVLILGIYYKLQTFIYLTANGIIQGIRPLVGFSYGAKNSKRIQAIYHTALWMSIIVMSVGTLLCLIVPDALINMFTNNYLTIENGAHALRFISLGFIVSAISITISGTLEGLGKGIQSFVISLLRYLLIIVPIAYILSNIWGIYGIWLAFPITEFLTAIISIFIYKKVYLNVVIDCQKENYDKIVIN